METSKRFKSTIAALAVATAFAAPVAADHMMGPMMGEAWGWDDSRMMGGMGMGGMPDHRMGWGMMAPGMMGMGIPNLTEDQRKQIGKIRQEFRDRQWDLMGKMRAERFKLHDQYDSDQLDPDAIGAQQKKLLAMQQQMVDLSVETQKRIGAVLTKEQKDAMKNWRRHGRMMERQ
jgi:Spy/CpxP family protein refolding chaperone